MPQPSPRSALPLVVGLPIAVATGLVIPLQARINGALGAKLDDGIAAVQAMVAIARSVETADYVRLADVTGGV